MKHKDNLHLTCSVGQEGVKGPQRRDLWPRYHLPGI